MNGVAADLATWDISTESRFVFKSENIPTELKAIPQWVCWREEQLSKPDGSVKITKVPYNALTGDRASSTDSCTWATYAEALSAVSRDHHDGIGFALNGNGVVACDLDHCVDAGGEIATSAMEIVQGLPAYWEISPSGEGLRGLCRGKLPPEGRKKGYIEIYENVRYVTITGNHLPGTSRTIEDCSTQLLALHAKVWPHKNGASSNGNHAATLPAAPVSLDDSELLAKASDAKNGDKFKRLWSGDRSEYADDKSASDLALCSLLSFWTGCDAGRIEYLFNNSALVHNSWTNDHRYRQNTIHKAISLTTETYRPHGNDSTFYGSPAVSSGKAIEGSGAEAQGETVNQFNPTDAGNGELLAWLNRDSWRHDHKRKRDLIFRNDRWEQDATSALLLMAKDAARKRYFDAASIKDSKERERAARWSIQSEQRSRLEAAIALARSEPQIADAGADWDNRPMRLAVGNGVVDLESGTLRSGLPEDRLILHTTVNFVPDAKCVLFQKFICQISGNDPDWIDFVHRALGYSLTGLTVEQVLFILFGAGSNGKSVLISIIRAVLGGLAYNMPFSTLEMKDRASIPNDLAALADRRFVTASETNESARLNEARVKALTGCDPITARFLHSEFFTFRPVAKFWLAVNHKPRVSDDSYGFWRRVRLIPFTQQFAGEQADPDLESKLMTELPGILTWLVHGCLAYQKRGLKPPDSVTRATEEYREESDPLAQFIADRCAVAGSGSVLGSDAYKAYLAWAEQQGFRQRETLTATTFGRRFGEGFPKKHTKFGNAYEGVVLNG